MDDILFTIEERFRTDLDRVSNVLALYDQVTGASPGRPSVQESELLRVAVVYLHAALEDLLRGLAAWRLPAAGGEVLSQIPFVGGDGRKTTLTMGDLAAFRGKPVEYVITRSVVAHLERSSYNNPDDVARLLGQIGLTQESRKRLLKPSAARLNAIMSRRHQIAHRLDRNDMSGRGHHGATSLRKATVQGWIVAVRQFGKEILDQVRTLPPV